MKKYLPVLVLFAVLYSSCGKLKDDPKPDDSLKGILFTDTLSLYTGNVKQLNYTLTPSNYNPNLLVWKSSDTTVVSVSNTGKLSAKDVGKSTITLTNKANTFSLSGLVAVKDSLNVGLLAYYPFNNSTNDLSGHNFNGVAHNLTSAPDRFGKPNAAYSFNGTSSYVIIKDKQPLRLNGIDFSLNYWVNLDNYSPSFGTVVISKRGLGYTNGWITGVGGYANASSIVGKYGTITYNVSGGTDPFAYGQLVVGLKAWHMITVVYNYSLSSVSLYVDGVFDRVTNDVPAPNASTNSDMYIGADSQGYDNPSYSDYLVKGGVDDIRIYNRLLNANAVHKLFVATK